ncbi:MAG: hypothetical protein C0467_32790 [Planctomycetaceae bacterium]|nr:hypothetical protein [Planctomycetaceae bacterium]
MYRFRSCPPDSGRASYWYPWRWASHVIHFAGPARTRNTWIRYFPRVACSCCGATCRIRQNSSHGRFCGASVEAGGRVGDVDHELETVRRAQTGDREAFATLVDRYWNPVRNWLAALSGQVHTAEDLAQETFLKAWAALPKLAAGETFRVWLFRIARNEYLALVRSPRSLKRDPLAESPDPAAGPPEQAEVREAATALRAAVEKLPETYRSAYLLWTHEELPYPELARVLDVSEETARWRVCEARRKLAVAMRRFLGDERR